MNRRTDIKTAFRGSFTMQFYTRIKTADRLKLAVLFWRQRLLLQTLFYMYVLYQERGKPLVLYPVRNMRRHLAVLF